MRRLWSLALGLALLSGCAWLHHQPDNSSQAKWPAVPPPSTNTPPVADTNPAPPPSTPPTDGKVIVTQDTSLHGKVVRVNANARFAVLNFPVGSLPVAGDQLDVFRHGLKVGEVRVTGPQQEDNTVADITDGEAQVGDELRTR
jgi:hypothetical protein